MVAGCGNKMLKYILLFLNFLVFIMALVGLIASLVFILKPDMLNKAGEKVKDIEKIRDQLSAGTVKAGLYVILGASVVILIIAFLGCCGAWKEIKFLLGLYSTVLLLLLIAEVAAFVVAIVFRGKAEKQLKEGLNEFQKKNQTLYNEFEEVMKCCGVENTDNCTVPHKSGTKAPEKIGCYTKIMDLLKKYYTLILGVSIVTIIVEILLICFSCCLCNSIGENVA